MPVNQFNHFNLRADRVTLDSLRDFYTDVIGLRLGLRPPFASFGYWLYIGEQAILHLSEVRPYEERLAHVSGTFDHVAFSCSDRAAMEAHLNEKGISFRSAQVPATGLVQLFILDPAGNGVELNFDE